MNSIVGRANMQSSALSGSAECPTERELQAFDQGYLAEDDIDRVTAHLETGCSLCREVLARISSTPDEFAQALREVPGSLSEQETCPILGHYQLIAEIGRGGIGIVYRATDQRTKRTVAVKRLILSPLLSPLGAARFRQEVLALAKVEHPSIVRLYDSDLESDVPYLVMEYIDGASLSKRSNGRPLPPREAATLLEKVAAAVQVVHEVGLLHRDLKPANILLTSKGEPKVTDFGLARPSEDAEGLTRTGVTVGTPEYMPPEQATGDLTALTPATDVYALGATLYELLVGRPPFLGANTFSIIDQVVKAEPVRLATLQPSIPRDLETVCLKCLEKDPRKRYSSARELGADLRRYLEGMPILARPIRLHSRMYRRAMRNKLVSALLSVVLLVVLGGGAYSAYRWMAERSARRETEETAYGLRIRDADREWIAGRSDKALVNLDSCPIQLRAWEWHYLKRRCSEDETLCGRHENGIGALAVTRDGKHVRSIGGDGFVRDWDIESRQPAGTPLAIGESADAFAWDGHAEHVAVHFQGSRQIDIWDVEKRRLLSRVPTQERNPASGAPAIALSVDGRLLATGNADGEVAVWHVENGANLSVYCDHVGAEMIEKGKPKQGIISVLFTPDGRGLVSCTRSACRLSDVASGKPLRAIQPWVRCPEEELHHVFALGFVGAKNDQLLTASRVDLRIPENAELLLHGARAETAAYVIANDLKQYRPFTVSRDGTLLAYAIGNRTLIVRELPSGREIARIRSPDHLSALALTPDSKRVITGANDGSVRVWRLDDGAIRLGQTPRVFGLAAADEGRVVIFTAVAEGGNDGHSLCVWDRISRKPLRFLELGTKGLIPSDLSTDDSRLAVGMTDGSVQIWDWRSGSRTTILTGPTAAVVRVRFTSNHRVVAAARDGAVWIWDLAKPSESHEVYRWAGDLMAADVSPDGRIVAVGGGGVSGGQVFLVRIETGEVLRTIQTGCQSTYSLAFGPKTSAGDPRLAISLSAPSSLQVWDWQLGRLISIASEPHNMTVPFTLFTPDGQRVITGSWDGMVKVWDAQTGFELLVLCGHTAAVNRGVMLQNGMLFTSSWDGSVRVWDGRAKE